MAERPKVKINRKAVGALLKGKGVAALCTGTARRIAAAVDGDAYVSTYTTDRRAAGVTVPAEDQARDGALTRAAAAVGLTVRAS